MHHPRDFCGDAWQGARFERSVRWFFTRIRLSSQAQLEEEAGGGLVRLVGELNPDDLYGEECFLEVYHPDRPSSTPASEMFAAANICPPLL